VRRYLDIQMVTVSVISVLDVDYSDYSPTGQEFVSGSYDNQFKFSLPTEATVGKYINLYNMLT